MQGEEKRAPVMVSPRFSISAILLTLGESTSEQAHRSLLAQSIPLREIVVIKGVTPFGEAFNAGARAVTEEFFIQCDADMVLHPHCAERLFEEMGSSTGSVVGHLDDPLQGRIRGVKLFRTALCRDYPVGSQPHCESVHEAELDEHGWASRIIPDVLGLHRQDLDDELYQFERFRLLGIKTQLKSSWWDLTYRLGQLADRLELAPAVGAAAALLTGTLLSHEKASHSMLTPSPEYRRWQEIVGLGQQGPLDLDTSHPFFAGWQQGVGPIPQLEPKRLVRNCLSSWCARHWLFLAGFLSASMTFQRRSAQECFSALEPWSHYLTGQLQRTGTLRLVHE